jgi:hypothetical protein
MQDNLRDSLEELRAEVRSADLSNADTKARLDALIGGIEARLDREDDEAGEKEHETLLEHVRDLVGQLETEHPRATSILNRIMVSLGGAGI